MKIEFVTFPGCPNGPTLLNNLRAALRRIGAKIELVDLNQQKLPKGDVRCGYPVPTILLDGRDLFGMGNPANQGPGCRVYVDGIPSTDQIAEHIERAMRSGK